MNEGFILSGIKSRTLLANRVFILGGYLYQGGYFMIINFLISINNYN